MNDANEFFENLSNDLCIISNWANQWKMSFNLDGSKKAQEVISSREILIQSHPVLTFSNSLVIKTMHQKHLGFSLDEKIGRRNRLFLCRGCQKLIKA